MSDHADELYFLLNDAISYLHHHGHGEKARQIQKDRDKIMESIEWFPARGSEGGSPLSRGSGRASRRP
jgi:hypothetical protein